MSFTTSLLMTGMVMFSMAFEYQSHKSIGTNILSNNGQNLVSSRTNPRMPPHRGSGRRELLEYVNDVVTSV